MITFYYDDRIKILNPLVDLSDNGIAALVSDFDAKHAVIEGRNGKRIITASMYESPQNKRTRKTLHNIFHLTN